MIEEKQQITEANASDGKETDNKKTKNEAQLSSDDEPQQKTSDSSINKSKEIDEFAEIPEDVLDEDDLKELEELVKENGEIDLIKDIKPRGRHAAPTREEIVEAWDPKTKLGRDVKAGKIKNIDEVLEAGYKILEPEVVDSLVNVKSDLISIGQAKGKFGGGKRRAWRQTQRKTKKGNVPSFSTMAIAGDENGHIGLGDGKAKETLPARDKAIRKAKLNIFKVKRGCSAFDCDCSELHTVPFKVVGKSGSVKVELIPAPQGTGLVVGDQLKKVLKLAGIKDVYSRTSGRKRTTFNLIKACIDALKKTKRMEVGG